MQGAGLYLRAVRVADVTLIGVVAEESYIVSLYWSGEVLCGGGAYIDHTENEEREGNSE